MMKAVIAAVAISLAAGIAIGGGYLGGQDTTTENAADTAAYIDSTAPFEERIATLERVIAEERNARLVLEDTLNMLFDELDQYEGEISRGGPAQPTAAEAVDVQTAPMGTLSNRPPGYESREDYLVSQLVGGGFDEDRANYIVDLSEEFQWEAMQARYEARQNGEGFDWASLDPTARLRAELGDSEYEQYLDATGQPSVVAVQSVMATSPANRVGIQPGDEIRAYDGRRIFNMRELPVATNTAAPGTEVVVEVVRDGMPMTLTMPAGPMGVQASGRERSAAWGRSN